MNSQTRKGIPAETYLLHPESPETCCSSSSSLTGSALIVYVGIVEVYLLYILLDNEIYNNKSYFIYWPCILHVKYGPANNQ